MRLRKGDTLIEVAIAIGIFSLVAVVIVQVIYNSISGAQSSLETTLTRAEMDAQAEALRFIHDGYTSGSQSADKGENPYVRIWDRIIEGGSGTSSQDSIVALQPTTCAELYNQNTGQLKAFGTRAFVINTRQLSKVTSTTNVSNMVNSIIVKNTSGSTKSVFYPASTYPRILYGSRLGQETLINQAENDTSNITRVEGLFIVPVLGSTKMPLYGANDPSQMETVYYYDFYISSCWMIPGSERPSTLATVVRLYDYADGGNVRVTYNYNDGSLHPSPDPNKGENFGTQIGKRVVLRKLTAPIGWTVKWKETNSGNIYPADGTAVVVNGDPRYPEVWYNLVPVWTRTEYKIRYMSKGSLVYTQTCYADTACVIKGSEIAPASDGYEFRGWCAGTITNSKGACGGSPGISFSAGDNLGSDSGFRSDLFSGTTTPTLTLNARWEEAYFILNLYHRAPSSASFNKPMSYKCYFDTSISNMCRDLRKPLSGTGYTFKGYCEGTTNSIRSTCNGRIFQPGDNMQDGYNREAGATYNLYSIWGSKPTYTYTFDHNIPGISNYITTKTCAQGASCVLGNNAYFSRLGYEFVGWCVGRVTNYTDCVGGYYGTDANLPPSYNRTFTGLWKQTYTTVTITLDYRGCGVDILCDFSGLTDRIVGYNSLGNPIVVGGFSPVGGVYQTRYTDPSGIVLVESSTSDRVQSGYIYTKKTMTLRAWPGRQYTYYVDYENWYGADVEDSFRHASPTVTFSDGSTTRTMRLSGGDDVLVIDELCFDAERHDRWFVFSYRDGLSSTGTGSCLEDNPDTGYELIIPDN